MHKYQSIIINWSGPYDYNYIYENPELGCGFYLITGKQKYKQTLDIQYCGITTGSYKTRFVRHHKAPKVNREQLFWLGQTVFPLKATKTVLENAESVLIYFLQPPLNEKKTNNPPSFPVTVINHWFNKSMEKRYKQHTLCKKIYDVLSWDGSETLRFGNLKVMDV